MQRSRFLPHTVGGRAGTPDVSARRAGFTLLELALVILIIGVLMTIMVPKLGGLTPRYRMRTYAREIGRSIQEMRIVAISRGRTTGLRYVLNGDVQYYERVPPAPAHYPDQPLAEREALVRNEVPPGVRIRGIYLPGTRGGAIAAGTINVGFLPNGTTGSHIVVLELYPNDGQETLLALKFNSISGVMDYYNYEVSFQHFES